MRQKMRADISKTHVVSPSARSKSPHEDHLESTVNAKILLVEDHEIVRRGLYDLIDGHSGWKVCGEAGNGKEAIEKVLALNPDLVLIDLSMPIMSGIEATKQIRRLCPSVKIVIVSMYDSQRIMAAEAGANAYVTKCRT